MDSRRDIAQYCIEALQAKGADKAQCSIGDATNRELNVEAGEVNLLRSISSVSVDLRGIVDGKQGSVSINKTDKASLDAAVESALMLAAASEPDGANDISPSQAPECFEAGPGDVDMDMMYDRLKAFVDYSTSTYPSVILEQAILDFRTGTSYLLNSNGVDFCSRRSHYHFICMFIVNRECHTVLQFDFVLFWNDKCFIHIRFIIR